MNTVKHEIDWRQLILAILALLTSTLGSAWLGQGGPPLVDIPGPGTSAPTPDPTPAPTPSPTVPTPIPAPTPTVPSPPAPDADLTAEVVARVNAYRSAFRPVGQPEAPLTVDGRLARAAQQHAAFMAKVGRMAHEGIGDGTPWDRIKGEGYPMAAAAENVAEGQPTAQEVVAAWLGSPGHRANIVGPYTDTGVGVARGASGQLFWCQVFASSSGPAPPPSTPAGPGPPDDPIIEEPSAASSRSRPPSGPKASSTRSQP